MSKPYLINDKFISKAKELGFQDIGFAKASFLDKEAKDLEKWLSQGFNGNMDYMNNYFDKRLDPRLLVDGAKTVISMSFNYFPSQLQNQQSYKIAKYAYGKDYHFVLKDKLNILIDFLKNEIGDINARAFTDSAPIMERTWAEKAGIAWLGKNTLALTKSKGSFFFLAEIICDIEFVYSFPVKNYCGSCTKCIDACPTQALYEPNKLDASKCISYLTIELKDALLPSEFKGKMNNWMYGCDICQDVCPINARSKPNQEPLFNANNEILNYTKKDWEEINTLRFNHIFKNSAVKRTKFQGLIRNIQFINKSIL